MADKTDARRPRALLSAILALAVLAGQASHAPPAEAQQRRGLLDMLFGGGRGDARQPPQRAEQPQQRRQVKKVRKPRKDTASASRSRGSKATAAAGAATGAAAATTALAPVEKSESARTVLVVGDFMAGSLAKGLEEAVSQNREIRVASKVDGSSGLVRDDHFDWPAAIGKAIAEAKPAVVVVMLGANDRQAIREAGSSLALRTAEWSERYTGRVEALAAAVRAGGASLVWVGALPFGIDRASEDMVYFNDLYRTAALKAGGEFVDVWGGFTDANGAFTASGPDMAGQTARLRNSDGITLTGAGTDKLAYFVEKPVTRILGLSVDDLVASLGPQQLSAADLPSVGDLASTTTTPPVGFSDPSLDGGDQLLGGAPTAVQAGTDASPRARLVVAGAPQDPTEGRADHFNWTGRSGAVSPVTQGNAIVFRGSTTLDELRRQAKDANTPEAAGAADAAARSLPPPPRQP